MRPHNMVEDHVFEIADRLTAADAEFCGCMKCLTDVSAYALSQVTPAYVTSDEGRNHALARLQSPETTAEITLRVTEAIAAVKSHPRH
ncbi:MAG: late competence development ComFB family protein [Acidimicrobiia bacterium]|nr:late competence development ComFB family protein [Acidimicrobiia bacterium]MDH4306369.1 late competence development ComFB family protein [Acidimicrobiia bacterium]